MPYLLIILTIIVAEYIFGLVLRVLNVLHATPELPAEFREWYDPERYALSQRYLRENARLTIVLETVGTPVVLAFILVGGFNVVDRFVRGFGCGEVVTGVLFAGVLLAGGWLLSLPGSLYATFVIEERYGFNRTTPGTWVLDRVTGAVLTALIGGPLFAGVVWFFVATGEAAWLWSWGLVTVVQLVVIFLAPEVILPLFNKFEPLPPGELRSAIEAYAREHRFRLQGIYTMDGSKRSTRANAYFTGFGRTRRIVLFDTLVEKHPPEELVAVLAHEMGHFRLGHIPRGLLLSVVSTGGLFYLLSLFIGNEGLAAAFGMEQVSVYASFVFFGILFSPVESALSVFGNALSRRHEYEADRFSARTTGRPEALVSGLKRLSVDNLSNLTPHPWTVTLKYSHPPVLARVAALRRIAEEVR